MLNVVIGTDQLLDHYIDQVSEFRLECTPPGDSIFFFLLNVLGGHKGGVIEQSNVTVHDAFTVGSSTHTVLKGEALLLDLFGTSEELASGVKVVTGVAVGRHVYSFRLLAF